MYRKFKNAPFLKTYSLIWPSSWNVNVGRYTNVVWVSKVGTCSLQISISSLHHNFPSLISILSLSLWTENLPRHDVVTIPQCPPSSPFTQVPWSSPRGHLCDGIQHGVSQLWGILFNVSSAIFSQFRGSGCQPKNNSWVQFQTWSGKLTSASFFFIFQHLVQPYFKWKQTGMVHCFSSSVMLLGFATVKDLTHLGLC